ncbi:hypothetical protein DSO57_1025827 [Entomophthora muscae]|uniref:Uncharacterized protein n=1 Tax=Entomophthora muscae TaxID=34485 RepID=A0ACC2UMJ8_9FUNG|nr:hypothetical protein DSO57_1025827 [Entomophthora muscae]
MDSNFIKTCNEKYGPPQGQALLDFSHTNYSEMSFGARSLAKALVVVLEVALLLVSYSAFISIPFVFRFGFPASFSGLFIFIYFLCEGLFFSWNLYWITTLEIHRPMPLMSSQGRLDLVLKLQEHLRMSQKILWSSNQVITQRLDSKNG